MGVRSLIGIIGVAGLISSACGASPTSPTSPTATSFALGGVVTGYEGAALQGAMLEVMDGVNKGQRVVADAQGRYGFTDLQAGGFTIQASAVDYAMATKPITLTADTSVDFELRVLLAQIANIGEPTLIFGDKPGGTFSAQGEVVNTGDGCAAEMTGTAKLLDKNLILIATLFWSMPPNEILRPGDRYTYEFCCLTRDQAMAASTFNANFRWGTVHCT